MQTIIRDDVKDASGMAYQIFGETDPTFAPILDAFTTNFTLGEEIGAALSVYVEGEKVVDIWGGYQDKACNRPWESDTIVCMFSVAKAFAATCLHMLVDRGLVDLDAPVATYWPEFSANGKGNVPIRFIMDHRAGLPVIDASVHDVTVYDFEKFTAELAAMAPLWEPGSQAGYHVLTMGYLIGAVVQRVTGKSIGTFLREEITGPLDLDYWIGLPDDKLPLCSEYIRLIKGTLFDRELVDQNTLSARAWAQVPEIEDFNSNSWKKAEIPGGNGYGTARAVAKFYAALTQGELDSVKLLSQDAFSQGTKEQWFMHECVLGREYHMSLGYLLNSAPFINMGPNPRSFGHHGVGGAIGFGDPDAKIGFCYAPNKMHARLDNGPRAGRIVEALSQCL